MGSCVDSVVMDNRAALSSLLAEQGVCVAATPAAARGHHPASGHDRKELHQLGSWGHSPGVSVLEAWSSIKDLPVSLNETGFIRWYFFSHSTIVSSVWACNS